VWRAETQGCRSVAPASTPDRTCSQRAAMQEPRQTSMAEQFFITGAARGLGLAMTRQLLERGDRVSVLVRKESDGLRDLQASAGGRLGVHLGDVTDEASIQQAFA